MQNAFKPFGAKDTSLFNKKFQNSLWKLTAMYVAILAIILFLSSGIIYSAFSSQLEHRYRDMHRLQPEISAIGPMPPTEEDVKGDLIQSLVLVNGLLLLCAGILSYWLAQLTLKPLEESYEQQRRFLGDASHELRTPLSILRTDLENELADKSLTPQAKQQAESNLEEVDRMGKLVGDLLTLSRLDEDGIGHGSHEPIDVIPFLQQACERLQSLAHKHNVTVSVASEAQPIHISSNPDLLNQAVTNIIKNAIIYNRAGGTVTVSAAQEHAKTIIRVADTGIGIAPEEQEKIFERFYRTDKSRSRQTGGNGLGLSIVKTSLERIGGSITITSEPEKGTIVTVILPS